jgi:hypothetical protein
MKRSQVCGEGRRTAALHKEEANRKRLCEVAEV